MRFSHLMMQKRLILALYTEKSIKTARVPRSSHKLSFERKELIYNQHCFCHFNEFINHFSEFTGRTKKHM